MQQLAVLEDGLFAIYGICMENLEKEGLTGKKLDKKRIKDMYGQIAPQIEHVYDGL
jgi:hypothetical protein